MNRRADTSDTPDAPSVHIARRVVLRGLAALPLVGVAAPVGQPAGAESAMDALLWAYKSWLHFEHRMLSFELVGHDIARAQLMEWHIPHGPGEDWHMQWCGGHGPAGLDRRAAAVEPCRDGPRRCRHGLENWPTMSVPELVTVFDLVRRVGELPRARCGLPVPRRRRNRPPRQPLPRHSRWKHGLSRSRTREMYARAVAS